MQPYGYLSNYNNAVTPSILDLVLHNETGHLSEQDRWNANKSRSRKGAIGGYQFMPQHLHDLGYKLPSYTIQDVLNPKKARNIASDFIKGYSNYYNFDNLADTLIGYNWGARKTSDWVKRGRNYDELPEETKQYLTRAMTYINKNPDQFKLTNIEKAPPSEETSNLDETNMVDKLNFQKELERGNAMYNFNPYKMNKAQRAIEGSRGYRSPRWEDFYSEGYDHDQPLLDSTFLDRHNLNDGYVNDVGQFDNRDASAYDDGVLSSVDTNKSNGILETPYVRDGYVGQFDNRDASAYDDGTFASPYTGALSSISNEGVLPKGILEHPEADMFYNLDVSRQNKEDVNNNTNNNFESDNESHLWSKKNAIKKNWDNENNVTTETTGNNNVTNIPSPKLINRRDQQDLTKGVRYPEDIDLNEMLIRIGGAGQKNAHLGGNRMLSDATAMYGNIMDYNRGQALAKYKTDMARVKATAKQTREDQDYLGTIESSLGDMDRALAGLDGGGVTGLWDGNVGSWIDSITGNPKETTRLLLQKLKVDDTLLRIAQTKGAISNKEMDLFMSPAPSVGLDQENTWAAWINERKNALLKIRSRLLNNQQVVPNERATTGQVNSFTGGGKTITMNGVQVGIS